MASIIVGEKIGAKNRIYEKKSEPDQVSRSIITDLSIIFLVFLYQSRFCNNKNTPDV